MSKAKSIVITVFISVLIAVAAFFAVISFDCGETKRLNSVASSIHLGADFSGYAYTTIYPKGVITAEEYNLLDDEAQKGYQQVGGLYADKEKYDNLEDLKSKVASDAAILNERFGQKGYSSYSVAVEDGVSVKISVPTNYTYAAYKQYDQTSMSTDLTAAQASLASMVADGQLTLRTTDTSITLTGSDNTTQTYVPRADDLTDTAKVNGSKTYSIAGGDDVSEYFSGISSRTFGSTSVISFSFTKEGQEKFSAVTTRAASSSSKIIYFFVGDTQLVSFSCESTVNQSTLDLQAESRSVAENSAITLNSAVKGKTLSVDYSSVSEVITSGAAGGEYAALFTLIASVVVLAALVVVSIVFYKKLGIVNSLSAVIMALIEIYAIYLLNIQLTFAVLIASFVGLALLMVANAVVFAEVRRLVATGRTMQASVKEAYKNVLMTVTDIHIVAIVVAILFAAIGAGEVAACGLLMVIATVASYVLYWFTRLMWYVISSPVRDKFAFAGLKRVVYDDED